jgi:quercetin dioxygenase-like cupin family protein
VTVIPAADRRTTTTPNATMTTCATPEQGRSGLAVWITAMAPGAQGPWHRLDGEQVLTVLSGAMSLDHAGTSVRLGPGDIAVLPADEDRRITADATEGVEMACAAPRPLRALDGEGTDHGIPDWMR